MMGKSNFCVEYFMKPCVNICVKIQVIKVQWLCHLAREGLVMYGKERERGSRSRGRRERGKGKIISNALGEGAMSIPLQMVRTTYGK
jgi:hypothetical protein